MFGGRRARPVPVTVRSYGEEITIPMRPLSALEIDQIRNAYPEPRPPRREVDGKSVIDESDIDFVLQRIAWAQQFVALRVCRMIGADQFGADDPVQQIALLKADFTEGEYRALLDAALKVSNGEITAADMEAAKERLTPTAAGSTSPATQA